MANKKEKSLGRGIDALFAENGVDTAEENVVDLTLADIRPNPYQPRQKFDQKGLNDLAASIEKTGVFQPIIVRQPDKTLERYEILAGERRFRASKLAGKTTIPGIVRDVTEEQMMEIAVLENLQREDLTPLEEAEAYDTLMTKLTLTQAQVSERLGKSRPYIANYLRLLGLPKAVKDMLQHNELSMGQARTLLSLKDKTKLVALAKRAVEQGMTVRALEAEVSKLNGAAKKLAKKPAKKKSPFLRSTENQLQERFGTQVSINESQGKDQQGRIEIEYLSNDDLNRILDLLDIHLD
ncbi:MULTISPECIES: ParB/RepB/Spo0J family partition protein [Levilactobacillus]|mgnify:FL=1|jgi:ParB family chromosome partitioning protein|uniref:Chromosome segregation DNA-binding protein n=1 Tax=Levilactobacillus brevis (strain ATCC 367 / BCRC 12310 / CIP 105137 / JCM 1170 / LMG 11437 / NCIMB 947 / NCTC 947) TaxID=387344 RepID=Q03NV3_LEVBA|nr:ParB/RepB/Spo0J family partition protein [Levilactobacillus brevis]MBL3537189.1 ParB/RepB/Spo0J family partition protein [Lactobacillus sp. GPR40-2]MBL3630347.1 ParB/RepB/Spo0J family partition protein [Lactobacillus sp. GPB7-4]ABJ65119.1 chromosome segregation DNA-binding protein [Levilactobacillus brevis ATCC 367]KWU39809.1 chromosome partitioning protein ParB [Levilactobacillus brevis]MCS6163795.1 ParB/RepB/Spo0J family partition protein [Levilactobacillus brevis]